MSSDKKGGQLTRLEVEFMNALWATVPANVRAAQRRPGRDPAYDGADDAQHARPQEKGYADA